MDPIGYPRNLAPERIAAWAERRDHAVDQPPVLEHHRSEPRHDVFATDGRQRPKRVEAVFEGVDVGLRGVPLWTARCRRVDSAVPVLEGCLQRRSLVITMRGAGPTILTARHPRRAGHRTHAKDAP
jgi:hypothetical protein